MVLYVDKEKCQKCGTCTSVLWALPDSAYSVFYLSDFNSKNKIIIDRMNEAIEKCPNQDIKIIKVNDAAKSEC